MVGGDPGRATIRDQEIEWIIVVRTFAAQHGAGRVRRLRTQHRQAELTARPPPRIGRPVGPAIEQRAHDSRAVDTEPRASGDFVAAPEHGRRSIEEQGRGRRTREELIAVGRDDQRKLAECPDVDGEGAHEP